jgi:integrase
MRYSMLVKIADDHDWSKKTYNNAISVLRSAFKFGFRDHPEINNPAAGLKSVRIRRKDRSIIDPFRIEEAEALIAAVHREWGEAQGNYEEFRFFTGLRPSEEIALTVGDLGFVHGTVRISKARVAGVDKDTRVIPIVPTITLRVRPTDAEALLLVIVRQGPHLWRDRGSYKKLLYLERHERYSPAAGCLMMLLELP